MLMIKKLWFVRHETARNSKALRFSSSNRYAYQNHNAKKFAFYLLGPFLDYEMYKSLFGGNSARYVGSDL
jgi:hypothetical protein